MFIWSSTADNNSSPSDELEAKAAEERNCTTMRRWRLVWSGGGAREQGSKRGAKGEQGFWRACDSCLTSPLPTALATKCRALAHLR